MKLEEELERENEKLLQASSSADNALIIEASQNIGKLQKEVDELFERLEVASDALDEVEQKYTPLFAELE